MHFANHYNGLKLYGLTPQGLRQFNDTELEKGTVMSRTKWIGALVGVVFLACGTSRLLAQAQDINEPVTFTGTIIIQNTNSDIDPGPPLMLKVATKDLLAVIARAEYYNTNYPSTNFPSGAKLIKNGTQYVTFSVLDKTNNVLIDTVSELELDLDLSTWTASNPSNGAYSETDYGNASFYIYEFDAGGTVDFQTSGYFINTIKNSAPNQNSGMVNSSQTFTIKALGGTGSTLPDDSENAVLTGSFSSKGTAQTF